MKERNENADNRLITDPRMPTVKNHETQIDILTDIGKALTSHLGLKDVLRSIMAQVNQVLQPNHWSLFFLDKKNDELYFCIAQGEVSDKIRKQRMKVGEGIAGWVAKEGKSVLVPDVRYDKRFSNRIDKISEFQTKSIICVPMIARNETLGVIELVNAIDDKEFSSRDLEILFVLAEFAAIAIANAMYYKRIKSLSFKDPLTVSHNIRFLHKVLDSWIANAHYFSLIFLDLDGFKKIVDHYGHQQGSNLLIEFAKFLKNNVYQLERQKKAGGLVLSNENAIKGYVIRYGGDEFILLLKGVSKVEAGGFAEHLLDLLKTELFHIDDNESIHLCASCGVSHYPDSAKTKKEIMALADHAMFAAKDQGKGRVLFCD